MYFPFSSYRHIASSCFQHVSQRALNNVTEDWIYLKIYGEFKCNKDYICNAESRPIVLRITNTWSLNESNSTLKNYRYPLITWNNLKTPKRLIDTCILKLQFELGPVIWCNVQC